jgi:hypothetical protein
VNLSDNFRPDPGFPFGSYPAVNLDLLLIAVSAIPGR